MMLRLVSLVLAAALITSGLAQSFTSGAAKTSTAISTSSSAAPTHTVAVGSGGLVFTPNQLTADVGDVVEFWFYPQNHSVARSDFKSPCIPYEDTGVGRQGFWSGFHPLAVIPTDPPKFQVSVNDTDPIFFYCSAPGACIDDGMIGVINANATETFNIQLAYAKNATLMFSPGEYFPSEIVSTSSSTSLSATATSTSTPTATAPTTITAATVSTSSTHSLSTGAIAGLAIGGATVLLLGAALIYLCGRQRTMGELLTHRSQPRSGPPSYIPGHLSVSSVPPTYPTKIPQFDFNAVATRRYSEHPAYCDRSAAETESYRSRSPPFEETRERDAMIPSIHVADSPEYMSPQRAQSPIHRRPVPESPLRPSPISPLGETMYVPLHMDTERTSPGHPPPNLQQPNQGMSRYDSQRGPHELAVESEPVDRAYN